MTPTAVEQRPSKNRFEVARRFEWAFNATGVRYTKVDPDSGVVAKGVDTWRLMMEDLARLGWVIEIYEGEPLVQKHLRQAKEALEWMDIDRAYRHICALAGVPVDAVKMGRFQLLTGSAPVIPSSAKLTVIAKGRVIKGGSQ